MVVVEVSINFDVNLMVRGAPIKIAAILNVPLAIYFDYYYRKLVFKDIIIYLYVYLCGLEQ